MSLTESGIEIVPTPPRDKGPGGPRGPGPGPGGGGGGAIPIPDSVSDILINY